MNSLAQNSVTQTTTTTTMASANVSTTTAVRTASNGRSTSKQEVNHLRKNQKGKGKVPFGELWDNEICWGGCSKLGTILTKSSIVFMGDGTFASERAFATMWRKEKTGLEERYSSGSVSILGKYNQGATDSVTVLGNKALSFHNFNGVVKKTVYDVGAYQRSGVIPENIQDASTQEVEDFLAHMKLLNQDYSLSINCGTMIKVESWERQNTQKTFDKVVKFTKGLYRPSCTTAPIHLFNWLHQEWPEDFSTGKVTVTPIDITFGAEVFSVTVNVYRLENGDVSHSVHPAADEKLGEYTINWWFPNKQQKLAEKAFYGHTSDTERVGFSGFRAGRNITHTPKIWGLPLYQDRARGIRLAVEVPASEWADQEFGIGTQKILNLETVCIHYYNLLFLTLNQYKGLYLYDCHHNQLLIVLK